MQCSVSQPATKSNLPTTRSCQSELHESNPSEVFSLWLLKPNAARTYSSRKIKPLAPVTAILDSEPILRSQSCVFEMPGWRLAYLGAVISRIVQALTYRSRTSCAWHEGSRRNTRICWNVRQMRGPRKCSVTILSFLFPHVPSISLK